jgi:hypothetical protein
MTPKHEGRIVEILRGLAGDAPIDAAVNGLQNVITEEVETRRAWVSIMSHDPFCELVWGFIAQDMLTPDTLRGAFAATFYRPQEIDDVTVPLDTPISLVDWSGLVDNLKALRGNTRGWTLVSRAVSIKWAPDDRPVLDDLNPF